MLDFSKDQVVEYIGDRMEEILGDGGVSYVKWDMNRSISDLFQRAGMRGTREPCTTGRYWESINCMSGSPGISPHVLFESCASGGARFDPGILYYAPQGWVSDDTDGVERVKIQYGNQPGISGQLHGKPCFRHTQPPDPEECSPGLPGQRQPFLVPLGMNWI